LHFLVATRERHSDYAILQANGLPPGLVQRSLAAEQGVLLLYSVIVGAALALLMAWAILPSVQVSPNLEDLVPPTRVHLDPLAAAEPPTAGRARVGGHDLARMAEPERERYRRQVVGYVWQHSQVNIWPELSALENVQVPMLSGGVPGREHSRRGRWLLEAMGLAGLAGRGPPQ